MPREAGGRRCDSRDGLTRTADLFKSLQHPALSAYGGQGHGSVERVVLWTLGVLPVTPPELP